MSATRPADTTRPPRLSFNSDGDLCAVWPDGSTSVIQAAATQAAAIDNPLAVTVGTAAGVTYSTKKTPARGWVKAVVAKEAWTAANVYQEVLVATIPARTVVVAAYADVTTKYAGLAGTISLGVGTTGNGEEILSRETGAGLDVKTAAVTIGLLAADIGTSLAPTATADASGSSATAAVTFTAPVQGVYVPNFGAPANVVVSLLSGTGNIGTGTATHLTTGSTTVYLLLEQLP